ncbi:unnamed protein product [Ambrosiozyma monospora]|uniref:Unnamed protein product n=1 Tax=Ambrosiozyma monospora TaxID=43982 RepID=A0A9W6YVB8_AMBMO|nr:unnamed protein product [Ambrosiozyma monospora]
MMAHHYQEDKEEDKPLLKSTDSLNSKKDEIPDLINLKDGADTSHRDTEHKHPDHLDVDIENGKSDGDEEGKGSPSTEKNLRNRNCKKILTIHLLSFLVGGLVYSLVKFHSINLISRGIRKKNPKLIKSTKLLITHFRLTSNSFLTQHDDSTLFNYRKCQFSDFNDVMLSFLVLLLTTVICCSNANYVFNNPVGDTTVSNHGQTDSTITSSVKITQTQHVTSTISLSSIAKTQPGTTVTLSSSKNSHGSTSTLLDTLTSTQVISVDTFITLSGTPSIDGSASKTTSSSTKFSPSPTSFTSNRFSPTNTNALYWASFAAINEFITHFYELYATDSVLANNSELANSATSAYLMWSELVDPSMSARENVWTNDDVTASLYNYYTSFYNALPSVYQQIIEETIIGNYYELVSTGSQATNTTQIPQQWSDFFNYQVCGEMLQGFAGAKWDEAAELFQTLSDKQLISQFYSAFKNENTDNFAACTSVLTILDVLPWKETLLALANEEMLYYQSSTITLKDHKALTRPAEYNITLSVTDNIPLFYYCAN